MSVRSTAREKTSFIVMLTISAANVFMTINQVNIASVYIFISSEFHETIYGLGILTAAFFLGYGLFELPGGVAAAKFGPRRLVILGAALNSIAVMAFSISPVFSLLPLLRFIAGLGFAFA